MKYPVGELNNLMDISMDNRYAGFCGIFGRGTENQFVHDVKALAQIEDCGYAAPFLLDKRKIYKIGVSFSSETRGVEEYKIRDCPIGFQVTENGKIPQ